jgi:ABC-type sugar transport system, periplasmic component
MEACMKKKLLAVLLISMVLFSFIGCAKKAETSVASDSSAAPASASAKEVAPQKSGVKLTLWNSSQTMADFYNETVIPGFLASHPEVESVEVLYLPIQDFVKKLAVVLPAGDVPDIMEIEDSWATPYVTAGYFDENTADLDAVLNSMKPEFKGCLTYNGKTYGVPSAPFHELLYWNLDMMAEAGIKEIPDTIDGLIDAAVKMTKRDADGNIVQSGFSMRLGGNPSGTSQKFWVLGLLPNGVDWVEESAKEPGKYHAGFDNEGGCKALQLYVDMLYKYKIDDFKSMKDTEAFSKEKTAINMREASSSTSIIKQGPNVNWTTSPMVKGNEQRATFMLSLNLYIPKDGKNKDLAREFIKYATSKEMYEVQVEKRACFNPYPDMDTTKGLDERLKPGFEFPSDLKAYGVHVLNSYDMALTKVGEALPDIFADSSLLDNPEGIKDAVHKLAEIVNDCLKEYDEYAK